MILDDQTNLFHALASEWMKKSSRFKEDGTVVTYDDWQEAWERLFSFTVGLYTGSKLNVEKLEELINSGNKE